MREIIPHDSRYIPLVQQPSCCVAASILMVMCKNGIPLISQELLAHHLGLVVSRENKTLFWNAHAGGKPSSGYGTRINIPKYHPNKVFPKLGIPLKMTYHPISQFTEKRLLKFLEQAVYENRDILACFNYGTLYSEKVTAGHLSVIDRVYPEEKEIRLIDPRLQVPKWRTVRAGKLMQAMEAHGVGKMGGLWEFMRSR